MLILKHDKILLLDEINSLKLFIPSLAIQLVNKEDTIERIIVNTDQGGEQINSDKIAPELCEYSLKKQITLQKHMNTKLKVHNCDNCSAKFKT